jgi:hypothetical protein
VTGIVGFVEAFRFLAMEGPGVAHAELEGVGLGVRLELNAGWFVDGTVEHIDAVVVGV